MFDVSAPAPDDVHLVHYGCILDQEVIFASSEQFEQLLQIVVFANSFAQNIHGGHLSSIAHEYNGEPFTTLVQARVAGGKQLMHVISGSDAKLPVHFQRQILENFTRAVEDAIPVKRIGKMYEDKLDEFTLKMIKVTDRIDQGIGLIHDIEETGDGFLVRDKDATATSVHYIGISTSGIPVRNRIYGKQLARMFKLPPRNDVEPEEILRSLISAQFSAIVNSSMIKASTTISEITITYTDVSTLEGKLLRVAFFPMGFNAQYTLEICYEGSRADIEGFKTACFTLLARYFNVPFKGSLKDFELVSDVLAKLPGTFGLFDHVREDHGDDERDAAAGDEREVDDDGGVRIDDEFLRLNFSDED